MKTPDVRLSSKGRTLILEKLLESQFSAERKAIDKARAALARDVYDDVYDEGVIGTGGRKYREGITLPVLMVSETEDQKRAIPEGRQPVELTNLAISIEDMRTAGVSEPFEYRRHLNDMFLYDGRYFSVQSYRVRGRLKDDVIAVVEGIEIYINQELPFDPGPTPLNIENLPWPAALTIPK